MNFYRGLSNIVANCQYGYFIRQSKINNKYELKRMLDNKGLLITIAFNNVNVIEWQTKFVKKFYSDLVYIVADNSTNDILSRKIEQICNDSEIIYIKIPNNPYKLSESHGAALNWVCKNIIAGTEAQYVGFLDHDCFPINRANLWDILECQDFYGVVQKREKGWYLWPGFSFFNLKRINIKKLNFLPNKWGDTGAGNYKCIYASYDPKNLRFVEQTYLDLGIEKKTSYIQENTIECYDGKWIHMMNASNWLDIRTQNKEEKFFSYLSTIYNQ